MARITRGLRTPDSDFADFETFYEGSSRYVADNNPTETKGTYDEIDHESTNGDLSRRCVKASKLAAWSLAWQKRAEQQALRLSWTAAHRRMFEITNSFDKAARSKSIPAPSTDSHISASRSLTLKKGKKHQHLKCRVAGCKSLQDFRGKYERERHVKNCHGEEPQVGDKAVFRCIIPGCEDQARLWARRDKFRAHARQTHPEWDPDILASEYVSQQAL